MLPVRLHSSRPCELSTDCRAKAEQRLAAGSADVLLIPASDAPEAPSPWRRLPARLALLTGPPELWSVVLFRDGTPAAAQTLWEAVHAALLSGRLDIARDLTATRGAPRRLSLSAESTPVLPGWLSSALTDFDESAPSASSPDRVALQAGLLQLHDQFDASHQRSQQVEGQGRRRHGDYWHAIHHRREPDYGNARYWLRHVGPHPVAREIVAGVRAAAAAADAQAEGQRLTVRGTFDPVQFTELVERAASRSGTELTAFAEHVQWLEMFALLEQTARDAGVRAADD
jgi:hypothetical protein